MARRPTPSISRNRPPPLLPFAATSLPHCGRGRTIGRPRVCRGKKHFAIPFLDVIPSTRRLVVQVYDRDVNTADDLIGEFTQEIATRPLPAGLVSENRISSVPDISQLAAAMKKLSEGEVPLTLKGKPAGKVKLTIDYMEKLSVELFEEKLTGAAAPLKQP